MTALVGWAPPTNTYRRRDSGHNHQGMNSLADSGSLLKQTGDFGGQSSSEDFSFEPWTSSPRLSGHNHNHQGMNSLADSESLLKQTGDFGGQSSSEDFSFEPWTFSPRLRANLTALQYSLLSIVQGA